MATSSQPGTDPASAESPILDPAGFEGPVVVKLEPAGVVPDGEPYPPAVYVDSQDGSMGIKQAREVALRILELVDEPRPIPDPSTWAAWRDANPLIAPNAAHFITVAEAAEALGEKTWPVVKLIEQGKLRTVRFDGLVLVSVDDVERLADA